MSNRAFEPRVIETGDPAGVAVRLTFLRDPDPEYAATEEERSSWGEFSLLVDGRPLTGNQLWGEEQPGFRWYLLDLLEWMVGNWDALLHEERLPEAAEVVDAAHAAAFSGPGAADIDAALASFTRRQAWLQRHSLQTPSSGGRFPNLFVRRWRGKIELSWLNPDHDIDFAFAAVEGRVRLSPSALVQPLYEALTQTAEFLVAQNPGSARIESLIDGIRALQAPGRVSGRLAWLAAIGESMEEVKANWDRFALAAAETAERAGVDPEAVIGHLGNPLVIESSRVAALLGSLSPNLGTADLAAVSDLLVSIYEPNRASVELDRLAEPIDVAAEPWQQGYELAEQLIDRLHIDTAEPPPVATLMTDLGVAVRNVEISDGRARNIVFSTPHHVPTAAVDFSFSANKRRGVRRFTLAHALCHLLFDQDAHDEVAVAGSSWAPFDAGQRARAFAAMFLMPRQLVTHMVADCPYDAGSVSGVKWLAYKMDTSLSTTLEHLHNLDVFDYVTRDRLREEISPEVS